MRYDLLLDFVFIARVNNEQSVFFLIFCFGDVAVVFLGEDVSAFREDLISIGSSYFFCLEITSLFEVVHLLVRFAKHENYSDMKLKTIRAHRPRQINNRHFPLTLIQQHTSNTHKGGNQ